MLKQDFQRAVLRASRHRGRAATAPGGRCSSSATSTRLRHGRARTTLGRREVLLAVPPGALHPDRRDAELSSLRSTLAGRDWRTLLQCFRTKIFLALSDDFSAHVASELCGKVERLKPGYTLTEAGQDARVSLLTGPAGRANEHPQRREDATASLDFVFQPKVFAELQNAQAIVLPYDGLNPWPPTLLLPEAALPRRADQLLRPPRRGSASDA